MGLTGKKRCPDSLVGSGVHRPCQSGKDLVKTVQLGVLELSERTHAFFLGDRLASPGGQPLPDEQHVLEYVAQKAAGAERQRIAQPPPRLGPVVARHLLANLAHAREERAARKSTRVTSSP